MTVPVMADRVTSHVVYKEYVSFVKRVWLKLQYGSSKQGPIQGFPQLYVTSDV